MVIQLCGNEHIMTHAFIFTDCFYFFLSLNWRQRLYEILTSFQWSFSCLQPPPCWILRAKKYLTSLSSKSVVRSPKSVVLSTKSESKVQNPNFLTKAGTISLGLELEFRVWQKRGHWLDLRRVIKKCGIFHNSIHQRALSGHSGSNQRAIGLDCVIPSEPKIPHLVVKLRSRSRLVEGQVRVRWASG